MLRLPCAVLIALLLAACGASPDGARVGDEPPQLRREGRWLVDPRGRVVLLHGVNLVWKLDPFVPPETAEGFVDADARWLADNGFNSARIGNLWVGISPNESGEVRSDYLEAWNRVVQQLAANRIWMLFDFHQDLLGEFYGGEGVPAWAVDAVRGPTTELLGPADFGFPFNYFTPQLSEDFDNLWEERGPVRDGFRDAWMAVARKWRNQPYSMGYDLFNEPWAGIDYPTCLFPLTGCPTHDADSLQPFFDHARRGIRTVDPHNLVWFQSQPLTSTGAPTGFNAVPGESQLGFSFHYYCPLNTLANAAQLGVLDGAVPSARDTVPERSEVGAGAGRAQERRRAADRVRRHRPDRRARTGDDALRTAPGRLAVLGVQELARTDHRVADQRQPEPVPARR